VIPTHIPINKTFISILTYLWGCKYKISRGILIKREACPINNGILLTNVCDEIFSIFDVKIEKF